MPIPVNNYVLLKAMRVKGVVVERVSETLDTYLVRHYLPNHGGLITATYFGNELIDTESSDTAYTLHINAEQAEVLQAILEASVEDFDLDSDEHPLRNWIKMLAELPQAEREGPGCLHGFCL